MLQVGELPDPEPGPGEVRVNLTFSGVNPSFSHNIDLDAAVVGHDTVIAAYATHQDRPDFPFWPLLFDNVTVRLFGSDDYPVAAKREAATRQRRQPISNTSTLGRYAGSGLLHSDGGADNQSDEVAAVHSDGAADSQSDADAKVEGRVVSPPRPFASEIRAALPRSTSSSRSSHW